MTDYSSKIKSDLAEALAPFRADKEAWQRLAWKSNGEEDNYCDLNEDARNKILLALQFDPQDDDEEFLQFLLEQGILNWGSNPFQGYDDDLTRAAFLLARFKNPANTELFLEAKSANFDTHCGFSSQYILSAGIKESYAAMALLDEDSKEAFEDYFGEIAECQFSDVEIEEWYKAVATDYPSDVDATNLEFWLDLALEIGMENIAIELLEQFEATGPKDKAFYLQLKDYKGLLGDTKAEIEIAEKLLDFYGDAEIPYHEHSKIARLYLEANQPEAAWGRLQPALALKDSIEKYFLGLLGDFCIEIVLASKGDEPFLKDCYDFGMAEWGRSRSQNQAEKRALAAHKMGDIEEAAELDAFVKKQKEEWEEIKKRIGV